MKKLLAIGLTMICMFGSATALAKCTCKDCDLKDKTMKVKCDCKHNDCKNHK